MSACIASMLDLPLDQVPAFCADAFDAGRPYDSQADIHKWLSVRGLFLHRFAYTCVRDWLHLDGVTVILSMPSQSFPGSSHAVIGQWVHDPDSNFRDALQLRVIHDPNPNNPPYAEDVEPIGINFLIPYQPTIRARPPSSPA